MNNISVKVNNNDSESNSNKSIKRFIKYYNDPLNQINIIRKDNNGRVGVYAWVAAPFFLKKK